MKDDGFELKIITYNIHSGKNIWMIPQLKKIIHYLQNQHAHIIGIQEINMNNKRGYQLMPMQHSLQMNAVFAPNVKIGNGYYGIATFAKLKIIKTHHIPLPSVKEQRSLLHTVLQIGNRTLNVLNTHLGLHSKERLQQFKTIEGYIQRLHPPIILMGDFNTTNPQFHDLRITDVGKFFKKESLPTLVGTNKRIDFIFVSESISIIDYHVDYVNLSDHYPVIAKIRM